MEIKSTTIKDSSQVSTKSTAKENNETSVKFADELKELKKEESVENKDELNQSDEKVVNNLKKEPLEDDNNTVINKDFNIQDKDKLPLMNMNMNMNFSGDGQPFTAFINTPEKTPDEILKSSATELAEEAAILSTMSENIAMANRARVETISDEEGVKRVNTKTGITVENIVKYDSIIMNQADVEVFANIVENNGNINMENIAPQAAEKSVQVSKTLADMLAKAKENNQPLRIDFDNNISVIIKISRDGKISADFLPSSQVAEAYLKENLPLLKQRFDENNIAYDELNHRENKNKNKENNQKKGRKDE